MLHPNQYTWGLLGPRRCSSCNIFQISNCIYKWLQVIVSYWVVIAHTENFYAMIKYMISVKHSPVGQDVRCLLFMQIIPLFLCSVVSYLQERIFKQLSGIATNTLVHVWGPFVPHHHIQLGDPFLHGLDNIIHTALKVSQTIRYFIAIPKTYFTSNKCMTSIKNLHLISAQTLDFTSSKIQVKLL